MRSFTRWFSAFLLLLIVGNANAAVKEFELDQKLTTLAALEGQKFAIVNETDQKAFFGSTNQNLGYDAYATAFVETNTAICFRLVAATGDGVSGKYYLQSVKADGTDYSIWGGGYLNSQPNEEGKDCCFIMGLKDQNGQDGLNLAVWDIEENNGTFALKNIGTGKYLKTRDVAKYDDPTYFSFYTLKEKVNTDPLAEQKDALTEAITKGKMINALAYTDATFATLTTKIADGEAALAADGATAESLTSATTDINTAIDALALKEGFSILTADMYKHWNDNYNPTEGSAVNCAYELFKSIGQPYGDGSVQYLNFADISEYSKLIITVTEGTPRIMMNRLEVGNGGGDGNGGGYVQLTDAPVNGVVEVDLTQYDYAHLNAIKGANYGNVTVTGMYLYKAPAETPAEPTVVTWDATTQGYENQTEISTIAIDGKINAVFDKNTNSNAPKYYTNGTAVRIYGGSTITISGEKVAISKVEFTFGTNDGANEISADKGTYAEGVWTITENTNIVKFTIGGTTGNRRIAAIKVTYAIDENATPIPQPVHIANTAETAYTVAQAIELIDAGEALDETVFVKGIVSKIEKVNVDAEDANKSFITYWISADGTEEGQQFECYKGKTMEGVAYDAIEVGAEVIVKGTMTKYQDTTYEFTANNELVSYKAPASVDPIDTAKEALATAIAIANSINPEGLADAITAAQAALTADGATVESIAQAAQTLEAAIKTYFDEVLPRLGAIVQGLNDSTLNAAYTNAQTVLATEGVTPQELAAAMQQIITTAQEVAPAHLQILRGYAVKYGEEGDVQVVDDASAAIESGNVAQIITTMAAVKVTATPLAQKVLSGIIGYVQQFGLTEQAAQAQAALESGNYITMITVAKALYTHLIAAAKDYLPKLGAIAEGLNDSTLNTAYADAETLLAKESITPEELGAAMQNIIVAAKAVAPEHLQNLKGYAVKYGAENAVALVDSALAAIEAGNVSQIIATMAAVKKDATPLAQQVLGGITSYVQQFGLTEQAAQAQAALESGNYITMITVAKALYTHLIAAAKNYLPGLAVITEGLNDSTLNAAYANAQTVLANENVTPEDLGTAMQQIIVAAKAVAPAHLQNLRGYAVKYGQEGTAAIVDSALVAIEAGNVSKIIATMTAVREAATPLATGILRQMIGYAQSYKGFADDVTEANAALEGGNYITMITTAKALYTKLIAAANDYVTSAKAIPTEGKKGVEDLNTAIEAAEQALAAQDSDFSAINTAISNLVAAVKAFKEANAIYIEADLTAQFPVDYQGWSGATGFVGWAAPSVTTNDGRNTAACERYNVDCNLLGDVFTRTLTGLTNGTYRIELYGAAANTPGRGCDSGVEEGDLTSVYLYAETPAGQVKQYIPAHVVDNFNGTGISTAVLDNVVITDGTVKLGMYKDKAMTNWHVVQIKGVTAKVDAVELYTTTLEAAQTALADEDYAVVTGEERTALETAVTNNTTVTEQTAEAYKTAVEALSEATTAFTAAKTAYADYAAAQVYLVDLPYANAEKKPVAEAATNATDAVAKTAALIPALRAYYESNAALENVEGAVDMTNLIINPAAEEDIDAEVWKTVLGEGSGGEIKILSNEPWTDAAGVAAHKYFDGGDWGAQAWDVTLQQEITLPAGRYLLTAKMRASNDVEQSLFAGENSATGLSVGATGGVFDRGWNDTYVEFELEKDSTITIGVRGVTEKQYNWMSFSDFRLVQFPKPELILTLNAPVGEEVTLTFGVYYAEDKFTVDFGGEDNTQTAKVGIDNKGPKKEDGTTASATKFTGTVGGDGTIKVYGINDIWYYNTYGNVLPTTFDQPKLMNVVQMSITGADVESVTLPAYPKMEQFSFNNSSVKSVDVTNVPTLTSLTINSATASKFEPQLESIDLSQNTELTYLSLQGNKNNYGKLTTLDLTNNTKLDGMGLYVQYNALTEIKFGENTLSAINVQDNQLTSLDWTKLTGLKNLYASNNKLAGEVDLSANAKFENVQLNNNELTSVKLPDVTKQLAIQDNKFTLATLPAQPASLNTKSKTGKFTYAPQAALEVAETVSELDLTSQLTVVKGELNPETVGEAAAYTTWLENQTTTFSFVTAGGTTLVEGTDYEVTEPGKFKFLKAQEEKVHAVMLNAAFPKFTEAAPFTTTEFTVEAAAEEVLDPDLVEIPQDQGKTLDTFARTELVEGEKYNTYTCTEGIQVAFKMFDIDVKNCDYVVVKFAEPVAAGWELAFWGHNDQSTVPVPEGATEYKYVFAEDAKCAIVDDVLPQICMLHLWTGTTPLVAKVKGVYKHQVPVEITHTWDFTKWSEATIANLKADAAASKVTGWSDVEKQADAEADAEPTEASKDNCFWAAIAEGGELTANGVVIEELKGLKFNSAYSAKRSLAIAVNYPSTSLGDYAGPSYLWLGGGGKNIIDCFTISGVKGGSIIKMGVESHKPADARGVKLFVDGTELTDPENNAVPAPKTYTEQFWQVPAGDAVDVVVQNTNGCHIYFIDAEQDETTLTSISTVKSNDFVKGTIYNMNGQKVNKAQKGLYIINGKKVLVK